MLRLLVALSLCSGLVGVYGCGGSGASGSTTAGDEAADSDELDDLDDLDDDEEVPVVRHRGSAIETLGITPPPRPWAEMNREDREMYMVGKVMPIMNELFQRQYGSRYPESGITCATCHGEDGPARGFAMPSAHLMPLPAYGSPASAALARSMPESIAFMRDTVTPTMGTLLGVDGYRCSHCHTSAP